MHSGAPGAWLLIQQGLQGVLFRLRWDENRQILLPAADPMFGQQGAQGALVEGNGLIVMQKVFAVAVG